MLYILQYKKEFSKTHAPKFTKSKDESWFVILADLETRELLAMRRIPPVREKAMFSLVFRTPENPNEKNRPLENVLSFYLISDGYLGLDQQFLVPLSVTEPIVKDAISEEFEDLEIQEKWVAPIQGMKLFTKFFQKNKE